MKVLDFIGKWFGIAYITGITLWTFLYVGEPYEAGVYGKWLPVQMFLFCMSVYVWAFTAGQIKGESK